MSEQILTAAPAAEPVLYARFPRRLQAVAVDGAILASLLLLGPTLAGPLPGPASRLLNRAVLVCILLYEPVLVSVRGSTIGHQLLNLRVVSSTTGRRLPFLRALLRSVVKAVFGIFSFFSMALTRRHQALHDVVAAAVVQVRDPARADAAGFATERVPETDSSGTEVSLLRRTGVAIAYIGVTLFLAGFATVAFVSEECVAAELCSPTDDGRMTVLFLILLALVGTIVVLGWRGRLPGAWRRESAELPEEGPEPDEA